MLRAKIPIRPPVEPSRPARSRQARPGEDSRHDSMGREYIAVRQRPSELSESRIVLLVLPIKQWKPIVGATFSIRDYGRAETASGQRRWLRLTLPIASGFRGRECHERQR